VPRIGGERDARFRAGFYDSDDLIAYSRHKMLHKGRLRQRRRGEERYLLPSNLVKNNPATLWECYLQLNEIEQAFKELKSVLMIRPIYHQTDQRGAGSRALVTAVSV
jgi:hypothetical protein